MTMISTALSPANPLWQRRTGGGTPTPSPTPTVTMDPAPASLDAVPGNLVTYQTYAVGKGPNADKYALGTVLANGTQIVRIYTIATGALLETRTIRAVDVVGDDHNTVALAWYSTGELICVASGHATSTSVVVQVRALDGSWSTETLTYSQNTTYPCVYVDKFDKAWLFIRNGTGEWRLRTKDTVASAFSGTTTYYTITNPSMSYSTIRYDKVAHKFYMFLRPNGEDALAGTLRTVTLDVASLEFSDSTGPLGKIGSASSNGKTLPFNMADVATLFAKPTGRDLNAYDCSNDGATVLVTSSSESDTADVEIYIYKLTGADRHNPAHYTISPVITNTGGRMSVTSNYQLGFVIARETHAGNRLYGVRKLTNSAGTYYVLEQWDNPSGDLSTWTKRQLHNTAGSTRLIARPMSAEDATETMPIVVGDYTTFTDYDNYTGAVALFIEPWRNATQYRQTTKDYLARRTSAPTDAWAYSYDRLIMGLERAGVLAKLDAFNVRCADTREASLMNLLSASYTASQAGGLANSAFSAGAGGGWTGDGAGWLDTGFSPTGAGVKTSQNNAIIGIYSRTAGQEAMAAFGNSNAFMLPRNASDQFSGRVNAGSSGTRSNTNGVGLFMARRGVSTDFQLIINGGVSTSAVIASAAPAADNYFELRRNGATAPFSTRKIAYSFWGNALGTTEWAGLYDTIMRFDAALVTEV